MGRSGVRSASARVERARPPGHARRAGCGKSVSGSVMASPGAASRSHPGRSSRVGPATARRSRAARLRTSSRTFSTLAISGVENSSPSSSLVRRAQTGYDEPIGDVCRPQPRVGPAPPRSGLDASAVRQTRRAARPPGPPGRSSARSSRITAVRPRPKARENGTATLHARIVRPAARRQARLQLHHHSVVPPDHLRQPDATSQPAGNQIAMGGGSGIAGTTSIVWPWASKTDYLSAQGLRRARFGRWQRADDENPHCRTPRVGNPARLAHAKKASSERSMASSTDGHV